MFLLLIQSLISRAASFFAQIILALILLPSDFGVIALASTVTTIIASLVGFGVDEVLVQRGSRIQYWQRTAFIISLIISLGGMLLIIAISPLVAQIYHVDSLQNILYISAIALPINALSTTTFAILKSNLNFSFLAKFGIFEAISMQILTIIFARFGLGPFSFVLPAPIMGILRASVYWWATEVQSERINRKRFRRQWKVILAKSSEVFGSRLATNVIGQADYAILGLLVSSYSVGIYYFAYRLSAQPLRIFAGNFQSVLYPSLVKLSSDRVRQTEIASEAAKILSCIVMPLFFLQSAVARPIFEMVFDIDWQPSVEIFQVLSIGLPFDAVAWVAGAYLNSQGKFDTNLKFSVGGGLIFVCLILGFGYFGQTVGAAVGVALYYILAGPLLTFIAFRGSIHLFSTLIDCFILCPLISAASLMLSYLFTSLVINYEYKILYVVVMSILFLSSYILLLWATKPEFLSAILVRLVKMIRRR